ncbi:hypothetical protein [Bacteroides sp. OF04-15BH]|jgi:hypothetical protein|uniref:hypothetical protein n=1 Tax=Bacteroides sp. OF04-15BH TaxID=2292281 RepID=UPI0011C3B8DD|nr:hypothetical protein [Bacteroides sp. OF04-15BH]
MRKKNLLLSCVVIFIAIATFVGKKSFKSHVYQSGDLLMSNVEALSTGTEEDNDCAYKNGYTAFTRKKGGGYDCCKIWVNKAPENEHCR